MYLLFASMNGADFEKVLLPLNRERSSRVKAEMRTKAIWMATAGDRRQMTGTD
jgi:hypothetical protein